MNHWSFKRIFWVAFLIALPVGVVMELLDKLTDIGTGLEPERATLLGTRYTSYEFMAVTYDTTDSGVVATYAFREVGSTATGVGHQVLASRKAWTDTLNIPDQAIIKMDPRYPYQRIIIKGKGAGPLGREP